MGHYDLEGFDRVEVDAPEKNAADDRLIEVATRVATEGLADAIWVASKDKRLLERVAQAVARRLPIRAVEDPEARDLPEDVEWVPIPRRSAPLPPEALRSLKEATVASAVCGVAQLSTVRNALVGFDPRDHGRESLRDLLKDLHEDFEVRESPTGGAVTVKVRR